MCVLCGGWFGRGRGGCMIVNIHFLDDCSETVQVFVGMRCMFRVLWCVHKICVDVCMYFQYVYVHLLAYLCSGY